VPTVLLLYGIRFYFYSHEETRMHIHVSYQGSEAKIWLDTFEVAMNYGFNPHQLVKIIKLVRSYEKEIKKAWIEHFPKN